MAPVAPVQSRVMYCLVPSDLPDVLRTMAGAGAEAVTWREVEPRRPPLSVTVSVTVYVPAAV